MALRAFYLLIKALIVYHIKRSQSHLFMRARFKKLCYISWTCAIFFQNQNTFHFLRWNEERGKEHVPKNQGTSYALCNIHLFPKPKENTILEFRTTRICTNSLWIKLSRPFLREKQVGENRGYKEFVQIRVFLLYFPLYHHPVESVFSNFGCITSSLMAFEESLRGKEFWKACKKRQFIMNASLLAKMGTVFFERGCSNFQKRGAR